MCGVNFARPTATILLARLHTQSSAVQILALFSNLFSYVAELQLNYSVSFPSPPHTHTQTYTLRGPNFSHRLYPLFARASKLVATFSFTVRLLLLLNTIRANAATITTTTRRNICTGRAVFLRPNETARRIYRRKLAGEKFFI